MRFLLFLLIPIIAFGYIPSNDRKIDADEIRVLNSTYVTLKNDIDMDTNNIFGITNLTVTGLTTLDTALTGPMKITAGVVGTGAIDLTSEVTGILPIANGGTGSATQNFVDLTTAQSVAGVKTFTSPVINTSISGTAILDEDGLTSNSDTQVATQQSIKAYVDASASTPSFTTVTKTTTATLATVGEDNVVVDATTADFTVTLPAASGNSGLTYKITKSTSANIVTIDANASETIGSELTVKLFVKNDSIIIACDGTSWYFLSKDIAVYLEAGGGSGAVTAGNPVPFTTIDDPTGGWTGTRFTVPAGGGGVYSVVGVLRTTGTPALDLKIFVNGTNVVVIAYVVSGFIDHFGGEVTAAAGDIIDIRNVGSLTKSSSGGAVYNYIRITKISDN